MLQLFRARTRSSVILSRYSRFLSKKTPTEDEYSRKTPREHVLLRPGMYVGQVEPSGAETWIYDNVCKRMVKREVKYSRALLKLFDEIIVNAADNRQRDASMSRIDVSVSTDDPTMPVITIRNDGKGIPVAMHSTEKIYIPELIFGHLMTGSNFDDSQKKVTGGRHGYGAKLANILSHFFEVETYDASRGLHYRQRWDKNMSVKGAPEVTEGTPGMKDYTQVTFAPDLARFNTATPAAAASGEARTSEAAFADALLMLERRTMDVGASIAPVTVTFNGRNMPVRSFKDYVSLFALADGDEKENGYDDPRKTCVVAKDQPRWQVAVQRSSSDAFEHMAFVNNIWTPRGGSHVTAVASQITKAVEEVLEKKGLKVSPAAIRGKLMVFVNSLIENPSFDSQSKDMLTTRAQDFGSMPILPKSFIKDITTRLGIVDDLLVDAGRKERAALLRAASQGVSGSRGLDIPKLEDAHWAGSDKALDCSLIITEGDSAKALAVAGLEVAGREAYGVLPLRGKILNVSDVSPRQLLKNAELVALCRTLGLDFNKTYERNLDGLRYGRVLLMCDQDLDGSHIKGLVINFFHTYWPQLLKNHEFMGQFVTPLMKVSPSSGGGSKASARAFYSAAEFEEWREGEGLRLTDGGLAPSPSPDAADATHADDSPHSRGKTVSYKVKYYKGLGTSTSSEGRAYFSQLKQHSMTLIPGPRTDDAIDLAFNRSRAQDRKEWIGSKFNGKAYLDPRLDHVSYEDFIDTELVQFSHWDNVRSIPSVVDGLKPSQRKVLFSCFKRRLKDDIKVVQLGGYVAEQTAYHHGDRALYGTIVNMAQDFVGANNVPLLEPSGQFGTRALGGKDYASPRYIFTRLSPAARLLFPEADDALLERLEEDGLLVEPRFFVPTIPTLLLNGCQGIGTGWSTVIPAFQPTALVDHVAAMVRGRDEDVAAAAASSPDLRPWVRGFNGRILGDGQSYVIQGECRRTGNTTVEITELPVWRWTADYKEHLFRMIDRGFIKKFTEHHTTDNIRFVITGRKQMLDKMEDAVGGLHRAFVLDRPLTLTNMHAFNAHGRIARYDSPQQIVQEHFDVRLDVYRQRRTMLMQKATYDEALTRNRASFIEKFQQGDLEITARGGRTRSDVERALFEAGFPSHDDIRALAGTHLGGSDSSAATINAKGGSAKVNRRFDYLLEMPFQSLTAERASDLHQRSARARHVLDEVTRSSAEDLWIRDLDALRPVLDRQEKV